MSWTEKFNFPWSKTAFIETKQPKVSNVSHYDDIVRQKTASAENCQHPSMRTMRICGYIIFWRNTFFMISRRKKFMQVWNNLKIYGWTIAITSGSFVWGNTISHLTVICFPWYFSLNRWMSKVNSTITNIYWNMICLKSYCSVQFQKNNCSLCENVYIGNTV